MRPKSFDSLYIRAPRLNQLNILNHAAANPHLTQSALARRCGLSVAMVNNYMRDLCSTGLLEYRRKSSKSVSYHITAEGRRAIGAIESAHLQELVGMFGYVKKRLRQVILERGNGKINRAVLYGSGDLAELVFHALESANVNIVGVCDPDPARIGREWCGREIMSPSQIRFVAPDTVVLTDGKAGDSRQVLSLTDRGIRLVRLDDIGASGANGPEIVPAGESTELDGPPAGPAGLAPGDQA